MPVGLPKLLSTKSCRPISIILNRKLTCYINCSNHNLYTQFSKQILTIIFCLFTKPQLPTELIVNKKLKDSTRLALCQLLIFLLTEMRLSSYTL